MSQKMLVHLGLFIFCATGVLGLRMETAKTSYVLSKSHNHLKHLKTEQQILEARYRDQMGPEALMGEAQKMMALKAPKSRQVVRVSLKGKVFSY